MYRIIVLYILFTIFSGKAKAQLQVSINGLSSAKGFIMIRIFSKEEGFLTDQAPEAKSIRSPGIDNTIVIKDLPYGKYAIAVFHDSNDNTKLDKNIFGIPKEGIGFSNNPRLLFGPPEFEEASFFYSPSNNKVSINLKYY